MARTSKPRKMSATVKSRRTAAHPTMSWKEESDEGVESEMDLQNEDEDPEQMDFQNALKKMLYQETKKPTGHPNSVQIKKSTIYQEARKNAKQIVKAGISMLDEIETKMSDLRAQEVAILQEYDDEEFLLRQQDFYEQILLRLTRMLNESGALRTSIVNATSEMLQGREAQRQETLRHFSKSMRDKLEDVKTKEKDAEDAEALIKSVKDLLRV